MIIYTEINDQNLPKSIIENRSIKIIQNSVSSNHPKIMKFRFKFKLIKNVPPSPSSPISSFSSLSLLLSGYPVGCIRLRSHPYVSASVRGGSATRCSSDSVQACVDYVFRPRPADSLGSRLWQCADCVVSSIQAA